MLQIDLHNKLQRAIKRALDGNFFMGTIGVFHQKTYNGDVYTISKTFVDVAADGYAAIRIVTPADKRMHMQLFVGAEAKAYLKTYSGTTYTNDGALYVPMKRNGASSKVAQSVIYIDPTVNVLGTMRADDLIGGGHGVGHQAGGTVGDVTESILPFNADHLIRVQNKAAQAEDINIVVNFYEEGD